MYRKARNLWFMRRTVTRISFREERHTLILCIIFCACRRHEQKNGYFWCKFFHFSSKVAKHKIFVHSDPVHVSRVKREPCYIVLLFFASRSILFFRVFFLVTHPVNCKSHYLQLCTISRKENRCTPYVSKAWDVSHPGCAAKAGGVRNRI